MIINQTEISKTSPAYIIAEMSGNHGGSFEKAIEIIHASKRAGANAVKLQTYRADTITIDCESEDFLLPDASPWAEEKTLFDLYKKAYTPWEWHEPLFVEAKKIGIDIFSSPFDLTAVDFLENINTPAYKIASPEITDIPLIKKVASTGKPCIMSTGLSNKEDLQLAVTEFKKAGGTELILLKCTTSYPAPLDEANLATLTQMAADFDCLTGVSDHTDSDLVPVVSVALGGKVIEKHIMLNDSMETVDSFFSITEAHFTEMVNVVRKTEQALGKSSYDVSESSKKNLNGRRSLYVSADILKGAEITINNIKSVRPSLGLHPQYYDYALGKKALKDLKKGERLTLDIISGEINE